MLCGIYLSIIWIKDFTFEGTFSIKEEIWRTGVTCFTAFGIILLFTILSQLVLLFLSLSRLIFVIQPINNVFKRTKFVTKALIYMSVLSGVLSFFITFIVKGTGNKLPFSLYLPFIDPTNSIGYIKIITLCVVISQTFTSIVITGLHILLVYKYLESQKSVTKSNSDSDFSAKFTLIVQLLIITASNVLSWFPVNVIYIITIFITKYPTDLVIWTTVGVLPLNSIINPAVLLLHS